MGLKSVRSGQDLLVVLLGTVLSFTLASAFELREQLSGLLLRFEAWQLDEVPLTLTALSLRRKPEPRPKSSRNTGARRCQARPGRPVPGRKAMRREMNSKVSAVRP